MDDDEQDQVDSECHEQQLQERRFTEEQRFWMVHYDACRAQYRERMRKWKELNTRVEQMLDGMRT